MYPSRAERASHHRIYGDPESGRLISVTNHANLSCTGHFNQTGLNRSHVMFLQLSGNKVPGQKELTDCWVEEDVCVCVCSSSIPGNILNTHIHVRKRQWHHSFPKAKSCCSCWHWRSEPKEMPEDELWSQLLLYNNQCSYVRNCVCYSYC